MSRIRIKTRWLASILLMLGILAVGIVGMGVGVSGADSNKVYVTSAPWEKAAPANQPADVLPETLARLIEQRKHAHPKSAAGKCDLPSSWTDTSTTVDNRTGPAAKVPSSRHKTFDVASPWVMAETKKSIAKSLRSAKNKTTTTGRSRKQTSPESRGGFKTYKITYNVKKLPKPQKTFKGVSPWATAAPASETKPAATRIVVVPPGPYRVIACELRLVRVSDGKVLSQVSALDSYANINHLAEIMVERLTDECPGGKVVVMALCNRRGTTQGQLIAGEMSSNVAAALKESQGLEFVRTLNLREILAKEQTLECAKDITASRFKILLNGADYVLIGGVALNEPPHTTLDLGAAKAQSVSISNVN